MVEIVSMSGESENPFQISEADYNAKSKLLQNFVNELYSHNLNPVNKITRSETNSMLGTRHGKRRQEK